MQYSDSLIGTWPFCRVRLMEGEWKRTYAIGSTTASLASSTLKLLPSRACLKTVGGAVARAGGHKERASNLWKRSAGREPRKASMCIRLLSSSCLSSAYPTHSLLAPRHYSSI